MHELLDESNNCLPLPSTSTTNHTFTSTMKKKLNAHLTYNCHWIASLKKLIVEKLQTSMMGPLNYTTIRWALQGLLHISYIRDICWRNCACVLFLLEGRISYRHNCLIFNQLYHIRAFCRASKLLGGVCGDLFQAGKLCRQIGTLLLEISCRNNRVLASSLHSSAEMPLQLWVFYMRKYMIFNLTCEVWHSCSADANCWLMRPCVDTG